jgi:hypothetical protein
MSVMPMAFRLGVFILSSQNIRTMILLFQLFFLFMITDQPRQVLLFYNEKGTDLFQKQTAEFHAHEAGMKERDIVVKTYTLSSENSGIFKKWKIKDTEPFTFILIGRDGGEKHRSNEFISHQILFGKIDAMPMRKNEIQNNK